MNFFHQLGKYSVFLTRIFARPDKPSLYFKQIIFEIIQLGYNSVGIVILVSVFIGAAITLQTAYNVENPLVPNYIVGLTVRDSMLLEFSSTIVCIVLAGKVGSNIASEIGTMRVTEQIDALEIMGVNPAGYLILPKIIGFLFIVPFLVIISMLVGIGGGYIAGISAKVLTGGEFIYGLRYAFIPYYITYSIIKSEFFALIITSVSGFQGYYVTGGALDVGKASTKAVVYCIILILLFDLVLTELLLT